MARPIRVQFGGAVYHCCARGNPPAGGQRIFRDDEDRECWLETVGQMHDQGVQAAPYVT